MTNRHKGLLFAHAAAILFGMTGILGALIQTDATLITLGRSAFAFLSLFVASLLLRIGLTQGLNRKLVYSLIFSGILLSVHWTTFFYSIKIGGVAMATLGFASFPAFITLIERFVLHDKVNMTSWLLVLTVMIGLVLVSPDFDFQNSNTAGLIWGIFSGFSFGALAVVNRTMGNQLNPVVISFWQNLIVAISTIPALFFINVSMTISDVFWLAVLGIICTALSHFLFVSSVQFINARTTGLIISLEPVYAILVAWLLFNEEPTIKMLIGGVLIIGAAIYPSKQH